MSSQTLSAMTEHAVQGILDPARPLAQVQRELARAWPEAAALEVGLALASACHAIEQMYVFPPAIADRVAQTWRLAALIGGDVLALQSLGRPHATGAHLLDWWDAP